MIDATFLKSLTKEHPEWMSNVYLITLDGEPYYAATNSAICVAIRNTISGVEAIPELKERLPNILNHPATIPLDYAAFKAWVGPFTPQTTKPCPECNGWGKYNCRCGNACCQGYVDPCDACAGDKVVTVERDRRYALLGKHVVDCALLADAFAHLDAIEATIGTFTTSGKNYGTGFIVRTPDWVVAFMECTPDPDKVHGAPFPLEAEKVTA